MKTENQSQKQTLLLSRKNKVESIISKRKQNIAYLKSSCEGGKFWLNICLLTNKDIEIYTQQIHVKQRVIPFYYLMISLDYMMDNHSKGSIIKSLCQLMEEYDFYASNLAIQGMKSMMAKNTPFMYPQAIINNDIEDDSQPSQLYKPCIYKYQNSVVFEQFKTPHIPFQLDYMEVLISLCDTLNRFYDMVLHLEESYRCVRYYYTSYGLNKYLHYFYNVIITSILLYVYYPERSERPEDYQQLIIIVLPPSY